jgi:hypothetical protein
MQHIELIQKMGIIWSTSYFSDKLLVYLDLLAGS